MSVAGKFALLLWICLMVVCECQENSRILHSLPGDSNVHIHRTFPSSLDEETRDSKRYLPLNFNPSQIIEQSYSPFNPRFSVSRNQISDAEWARELRIVYEESGLVPSLFKTPPLFLINVNFGHINCVHMGTELSPHESAYPPTSISYPSADDKSLHTIIMLEAEEENFLRWMIADVPGSSFELGKTISEYKGPAPLSSQGLRRYVLIMFVQNEGAVDLDSLKREYGAGICDDNKRRFFSLYDFIKKYRLSQPVAANYFTVSYEPYVDSMVNYCQTLYPLIRS